MEIPNRQANVRNADHPPHTFGFSFESWMTKKATGENSNLFFFDIQMNQAISRMAQFSVIKIIVASKES